MTNFLIRSEIEAMNPIGWDRPAFFDVKDNALYKQGVVWHFKDMGSLSCGIPYNDKEDIDSIDVAKAIAGQVLKEAKEAVEEKKGSQS